jgi:hypothetical protein
MLGCKKYLLQWIRWYIRDTVIDKNSRIKYLPEALLYGKYFRGSKITLLHKEQGYFLAANIIFAPQEKYFSPQKFSALR